MPEIISADGARVLADLNALRAIGTYESGVHKPTFSEAHMRSLEWLAARLPEAGLCRHHRWHRQRAGRKFDRRGPSCSRARILKAKIMPAGSTGRSA